MQTSEGEQTQNAAQTSDKTHKRRVRYSVAASLDGYIAGPNGEADWIIMDPDIDFSVIFIEFDTQRTDQR